MRSLSFDRNVVQFYGACLEREYAMLVLEYMEGGDLCQAIQEKSYPVDTRELSWYQKGGGIALDIAKGLVFLHQHGVSLLCCASFTLSQTTELMQGLVFLHQHGVGLFCCASLLLCKTTEIIMLTLPAHESYTAMLDEHV